MNCYATLSQVQAALLPETVSDTSRLLDCLIAASRGVDEYCNRTFYVTTETRLFDVDNVKRINIDDLVSLTTIKYDSSLDGTFGTSPASTDYKLWPPNRYPKTSIDVLYDRSSTLPILGFRTCEISGQWGYGDCTSAPWATSSITITVATTTGTTVTASASGLLAGQTIRSGNEDMFISSVDTLGTSLTVIRGVNGTVAETHTTGAVRIARYPQTIINTAIIKAIDLWRMPKRLGIRSESIGGYNVSYKDEIRWNELDDRLLHAFTRVV